MMHRAHTFFLCVVLSLGAWTSAAEADGGAVVWTGERLGAAAAILVSPASPRVGTIDVAWIGDPRAAMQVVATHESGVRITAVCLASDAAKETHAQLLLSTAGAWRIEIQPNAAVNAAPVSVELVVDEAMPNWSSFALYLFAWVPLAAIGGFAAARRMRGLRVG